MRRKLSPRFRALFVFLSVFFSLSFERTRLSVDRGTNEEYTKRGCSSRLAIICYAKGMGEGCQGDGRWRPTEGRYYDTDVTNSRSSYLKDYPIRYLLLWSLKRRMRASRSDLIRTNFLSIKEDIALHFRRNPFLCFRYSIIHFLVKEYSIFFALMHSDKSIIC